MRFLKWTLSSPWQHEILATKITGSETKYNPGGVQHPLKMSDTAITLVIQGPDSPQQGAWYPILLQYPL